MLPFNNVINLKIEKDDITPVLKGLHKELPNILRKVVRDTAKLYQKNLKRYIKGTQDIFYPKKKIRSKKTSRLGEGKRLIKTGQYLRSIKVFNLSKRSVKWHYYYVGFKKGLKNSNGLLLSMLGFYLEFGKGGKKYPHWVPVMRRMSIKNFINKVKYGMLKNIKQNSGGI